jgi:hypothetical protein
MRRQQLRCCGRFCFWAPPLGPWRCSECDRAFDGPMPANAVGRFWDHVAELVTKVQPWTEAQRRLARRCFSVVRVPRWELFS